MGGDHAAHAAGAVLAGASAGAMALGSWTWTPGGGMAGLQGRAGLVVVPHAREATWAATVERFVAWAPPGLGALGLAEMTGVIEEPLLARQPDDVMARRRAGRGALAGGPRAGGETVVARSGEVISTPVIPL